MLFPKPQKREKKKRRELDPKYVKWIHSWECCVVGCSTPWPVHAHHAVTRARMGSDRTCLPLCYQHHVGNYGVHTFGQRVFESKFNVDLSALVVHYNQQYDTGRVGPHFEHLQDTKIRPSESSDTEESEG